MIRPGIDAERLRGILDCMHAEADERDKHSEQIREIVKTAKEAGYDTKAVRKVFVRERMDDADRRAQDDLLETYEAALGGKGRALAAIAAGTPTGEAAKANGVHRSTVARARSVAKQTSIATTPHDADGVIIEDAAPQTLGDASAPVAEPVHSSACPPQPLSEGGDGIGHQSESCGGVEGHALCDEQADGKCRAEPERAVTCGAALEGTTTRGAGIKPGPQEPDWDAIVATQPPQLRRVPA